MREGLWTKQLVYGGPGSGKSYYGVSSFWDIENRTLIRPGLWVTFGQEDNMALGVPEKYRRRFTSPRLDNRKWLDEFRRLVAGLLVSAAKQDYAIDSLFVDGMSEFDLMFQEVGRATLDDKDKWAVWRALMSEFFSVMQLLSPVDLGAHVIVSARVAEVKKAVQHKVGNVEWLDSSEEVALDADLCPSLHGGFKRDFPHYFHLVMLAETDVAVSGGRRVPVHRLHLLRDGDAYIKNQWEHLWLTGKLSDGKPFPPVLVNPQFDQILALIQALEGGAAAGV